jgi:hypothetical protein
VFDIPADREKLERAVQAIKSGNTARGNQLLNEVLLENPRNVLAILWLTKCTDDPRQQAILYQHALNIEPDNPHALKGVKLFSQYLSPAASTPEPSPPPPIEEPSAPQFQPEPPPRTNSGNLDAPSPADVVFQNAAKASISKLEGSKESYQWAGGCLLLLLMGFCITPSAFEDNRSGFFCCLGMLVVAGLAVFAKLRSLDQDINANRRVLYHRASQRIPAEPTWSSATNMAQSPDPTSSAGALVACKLCGQRVAKTAAACPHCGQNAPGLTLNCPRCGSGQTVVGKKGFSLGNATVGAVLLGPLGLLGGMIGQKDTEFGCLACQYKWTIPPSDFLRLIS